MTVETLLPVGSVILLNSALVAVLFVLTRALKTTTETNIELNKEIKATAKDRHETEKTHETERAEWKTERLDLQCQLEAITQKLTRVEDEFARYKDSSQKVIDQLSQELVGVKRELALARQEAQAMKTNMDDLTTALKAAQDRVKELEGREGQLRLDLSEAREKIARLERDNITKDQDLRALQDRVKELETELRKAQEERAVLETANAELVRQLTASGREDNDRPEPSEGPGSAPVGAEGSADGGNAV